MKNVIALDLTENKAKELITKLAKDSGKVFFTKHAEKRMKERKVTRTQVSRCLLHGHITEGPYRDIHGNWKQTLETISAGDHISVVAVLERDSSGDMIIIITCY